MTLHRRQLPIASPCQQFVGRAATATSPAFCARCEKSVHDLSGMRESEVVTLLAKNLGQRVCVSYRARPDGSIATRRERSRFAAAALAVSLAGCAGHLDGADRSAQGDCIDADGYAGECPPKPRLADAVIPDAPVDAIANAPADPPTAAVEPTEFAPMTGELATDATATPAPLYPDVQPEIDAVGQVAVDTDVRTAGEPVIDESLARRVQREAQRLERREQRAEARRQRRLARR